MPMDDLDGVLDAIARINVEAGRLLVHLLEGSLSPGDEVSLGHAFVKAGEALKRHGRERQAQAAIEHEAEAGERHRRRPGLRQ